MLKLVKVFIVIALFSCELFANQNEYQIGAFGGIGLNSHSADFKRIPDCPNCSPGFRNGSGIGLAFGLVFDYPIQEKIFVSGRLIFKDLSGEFERKEQTTIITDNALANGEFTHFFNSKLNTIGFEPTLKYNFFDNLFVNLGANISFLIKKDYSQVEKITKPADYGTFLDENGIDTRSRERNRFSGEMKDAENIFIAPVLSLSYKFPLNKRGTWFFEPEAGISYGLTNIITDPLVPKWNVSNIAALLSIKYTPRKEPEILHEYKQIQVIDTIKIESEHISDVRFIFGKAQISNEEVKSRNIILNIETISRRDTIYFPKKYELFADISAVGLTNDGIEIPNPIFTIEEFIFNRLDPLLNYIFFDNNSSVIPQRYVLLESKDASEFIVDSLYSAGTLDIYYNVMNIIGERMLKYSNSKITLVGCNSDFGDEKGNLKLSRDRAENVRKYLIEAFGINQNRIQISERNLPLKRSTPINEQDKIDENRRVEILSDDYRIVEPVFIKNIRRTSNPPILRFKPEFKAEANVKSWEISSYQANELFPYIKNGNGAPPNKIDRVLEEDQLSIPRLEQSLFYSLKIEDDKGNVSNSKSKEIEIKTLTVSEKRINKIEDYEIEKFSLILFDFDKSNIEGNNTRIVDYIKSRLENHSIIEIKGYTDRTGDFNYNIKLGQRRAESTKAALKRTDAAVMENLDRILLYDNDYPEGRFYCRTVDIWVKTKK